MNNTYKYIGLLIAEALNLVEANWGRPVRRPTSTGPVNPHSHMKREHPVKQVVVKPEEPKPQEPKNPKKT
jgi:hypothetical protein